MKIPTWLRWSAVACSAFLAGFYVAYASGYMRQSTDVRLSESESELVEDVSTEWERVRALQAANSDAAEPDTMFSSSKYAPVFVPEKHQTPPPPPPQTWMYSSKSAPIAPPTTSNPPAPVERDFMMGSKSAPVFSDPPPSTFPPPPHASKSAPPSKSQTYKGKGAP